MKAGTVAARGMTFSTLEAGEGPLVLCLHGFPDSLRSFRHQLPALAAAGYRAVAPAMRGYAPTGPAPDGRYQTAALALDAVALIEALGYDDAIVFGHDWGAAATYFGALLTPHRIRRIVTAAVPYGPRFFQAFTRDYDQQRRSWYMMFFQQALADVAMRHDDFAMIDRLVADWSPGWTWPAADREATKATFRRPGTLEAALGYYRATMGPAFADPGTLDATAQGMTAPLPMPGLMLHGANDGCIGADILEGMADYFPAGLQIEIVPGAGHFVHQEQPDVVNRLVLDFLRA